MSDGTTEVLGIKSFHFHDQLTKDGNIRMGNVISASIDVEYYTSLTSRIQKGEVLTYYQVFDYDENFDPIQAETEVKIGVFTVYSSEVTKTTCRLVLYDEVSKLDIDYSPRLKAIQSNFPMTISALVSDAAAYAGVTTNLAQETNPHPKNYRINQFYTDTITVRDIFTYVAEIYGWDLHANKNGEITIDPYVIGGHSDYFLASYYYMITATPDEVYPIPDAGRDYVNVFYKQDGLQLKDYQVHLVDCVRLYKSDGTLVWTYWPDGTDDYVYDIKGNLLIDYMNTDDLNAWAANMCGRHYQNVRAITEHVPYSASLFTFRCPYTVGGFASLLESDGETISKVPVMSVDWTDEAVTIRSFGNNATDYEYAQQRTVTDTASVQAAQINELFNRITPIENGGTSQTGVVSETAISNVITAGSGFTITNVSYKQWGKVVQLYVQATKTEAQTASASMTVGTVVSGKRPSVLAGAVCTDTSINYAYVAAGGALSARGTWAANAEKTFVATYILP